VFDHLALGEFEGEADAEEFLREAFGFEACGSAHQESPPDGAEQIRLFLTPLQNWSGVVSLPDVAKRIGGLSSRATAVIPFLRMRRASGRCRRFQRQRARA
jgi:hypothetical protein